MPAFVIFVQFTQAVHVMRTEEKTTAVTRRMENALTVKLDLLGLNVRSATLILKTRTVHNAVKATMVKAVIKVIYNIGSLSLVMQLACTIQTNPFARCINFLNFVHPT